MPRIRWEFNATLEGASSPFAKSTSTAEVDAVEQLSYVVPKGEMSKDGKKLFSTDADLGMPNYNNVELLVVYCDNYSGGDVVYSTGRIKSVLDKAVILESSSAQRFLKSHPSIKVENHSLVDKTITVIVGRMLKTERASEKKKIEDKKAVEKIENKVTKTNPKKKRVPKITKSAKKVKKVSSKVKK